ncbi:uncharacterized protein UTRI_05743_B [Ustilago trichophora]|uniref:Uncharacterized protein n=1 Tax=Ustilago trichophora TaxID=86804 RepID=A0A5C3EQ56_9BASI|nr:uncharacterized protein UTRI_05743_B [Ustilago trichophora]
MSSFYDRSMSASRVSLDTADRSYSRSPSRSGMTSTDDLSSSRGYHANSSPASLGSGKGGAPMHAMMVPGVVVPTIDRPEPDSPFSQWEAYIVKQAQEWNDKRTKALASPPPPSNNSPRIVWADQIRKPAPQSQPFTYTKARDRVASPPPQGPPPPNPRGLLRKTSFDVFRNNSETAERSGSSPPSSTRPSISSPILTRSILTTVPPSPIAPVPLHAATNTSYDSPISRSVPDPLQVPHNVESQTSSIRSLSPLPLSLPGDDFSASLLINLDKRSSTASTSSGRAPGPSELIAAPLPALFNSENSAPPSIADTFSVHSRRSSWASSVDLDPAIICTPPLSHDGWQEQSQNNRPAFLAEYGLDQDTDESETEETECSVYPDDDETGAASLHTVAMYSNEAMQDQQGPPQPVFQRLEADLLSLSGHGDDMDSSPRFGPDGTPLPRLEISSLPREKEEIRKARARLISPVSFKKAFSIKKKGSNSGSSGSQSTDSSPSLPNSSSEEVGKVNNDVQAPAVSRMAPQLPGLVPQDMTSWAAAIPAQAPPTSPIELPASPMPTLQLSPSIDSHAPTVSSTDGSSAMPISPVFSNPAPSIASETSRDGLSSLNSFANGSITGQRRHRVATPGLTKVPSSPTDSGAAASLDPHLMRVKTRARSSGSVSSHTPSIALSNTSSTNGRRTSRRSGGRSGRSRITDSMPSFADMASSLAVPVSDQRRFSNRSLSSEGSIDNHSNASNGSSFAKVGGSSDDGMAAPLSPSASSMTTFKSVLRKRVPSEDGSLLSPKKEVSFDLPVSASFGAVAEGQDEEEEELLEHEQRQRGHLKFPPMKLQKESTAGEDIAAAATSEQTAQQSGTLSQDDQDILTFLSSFGRNIKTVESLELLDNIHAGSNEWPKREDWDSLPAYLVAYATTFLSAYSDDSATLVYSSERAPAPTSGKSFKVVSAPLLSSNPLYTSIVRSLFRIASWEQPLVSAGVSCVYAYSWAKGRLAAMIFVGLALLVATQGAQMGGASSSSSSDAQELSAAYSRIAPVLLGSASTHERMRNLMLWRSPKASLRFTGLLLALALGATRFDSSMMLQLPGLFVGLALFVWLPIVLHQPNWAPEWIRSVNPIDVLLYDVPTDAQHAILTLRRRAASGDQLVNHPNTPSRSAALKLLPATLSPTAFDHRVSTQELTHITDILESSHFATFENTPGHLIILASRLIFRTLSSPSSTEEEEQISLADDLIRSTSSSAKIMLDARLEKVVRLEKTLLGGLQIKLRNGQVFQLQGVAERDVAFNRLLALAPQKWH